jgi:hypothetical protein
MRARAAEAPLPALDTIERGTAQAGRRWAYRVMVGVGVLLVLGAWRWLDQRVQALAVTLHNWAAPHADRLTAVHTHAKPIAAGLVPHEPYFADPAAGWIVGGLGVTLVVAGFYLLGKTSPDRTTEGPLVAAARGAGKVTAVVLGGVTVLVLAGWLATKWAPARPVVGLGLRVVGSLTSAASEGIGVAAP